MRTVGIDLAAQPKNTAGCVIEWESKSAGVERIECGLGDDDILALMSGAAKVGIDAPLGWPTAFVSAISAHHRHNLWPTCSKRELLLRATDRFVFERTGRWPLSVSSNLIAVPALRAAALLSKMEPKPDRCGRGQIVEVYPVAALRLWGFKPLPYKRNKGKEHRNQLLQAFMERTGAWLQLPDCHRDKCVASDDAFDALIAALVARAAALRLTEPVPPDLQVSAEAEGWIALPPQDSLGRLC